MESNLTALAYLVASVLFVLALRGLSSPETSRKGNMLGMVGMALAIVTTILSPEITSYAWIVVALAIGAAIGLTIASRIAMTAMPQLVAAFHSLVGMAAVLVAGAAYSNPEAFKLLDVTGQIFVVSRIEMSLGVVIGAITFSGSIIAFTKLQGLVSGAPVVFKGQHPLNAVIGLLIIGLMVAFTRLQWHLVRLVQ